MLFRMVYVSLLNPTVTSHSSLVNQLSQLVFQQQLCPEENDDIDMGNLVERSLKQKISALEREKNTWVKNQEQLLTENKAMSECIEKMTLHQQRQNEFIVFPLLKLPDVVIFDIAQKLKQKHRRHLMQSCSHYRGLLHGKRSKQLDCRRSAEIRFCVEQSTNNDLKFLMTLTKPDSAKCWLGRWVVPAACTVLPDEVEDCLRGLSENFDTVQVGIRVYELSEHHPNHLALVYLITVASKYFEDGARMSAAFVRSYTWVPSVLLECTSTTSICLELLGRNSIQRSAFSREHRVALETSMKRAAAEKGIPSVTDSSGSEDEFVVRLDVSEDGVRTVTLCG